ncbi:phage tail protein [Nocardia brasiliensis]|uniref:Gp37-like protein n=1 Tax=Nocardia brasiliensis TaxID=37326 RepID=UPI00366C8483
MGALVKSTIVDLNEVHRQIQARKAQWVQDRLRKALIRIWDGDMRLFGEVVGELAHGFTFIENDTGTAYLKLSLSHYIAKWIINHRGREKKNVIVTFDKQGARWSGAMDNYKVVKEKDGRAYLEVSFLHDYEHLKHLIIFSNPWLPPELQFPKIWAVFGPARWSLCITLLFAVMRKEGSWWSLPDDPLDPSKWFNLDQTKWSMVVKPFSILNDRSVFALVFSRFKPFHDVAKQILQDGQLHVEARRYLPGDPPPWPGAKLKPGCLVFGIEDKSAWTNGTSFDGDLINGLARMVTSIGSDGLTENRDVIANPNFPDEYYDPAFRGTMAEAPWVVFEESPYTGIESSEFIYYEATDTKVVIGGHSAPGVNEALGATIIAVAGFLGSLITQSQIGSAVEMILRPLYTDVVAAFQSWQDVPRAQELGWTHYYERWGSGTGDRAYTLAALVALRAGLWASRRRTAHSVKIADSVPYRLGDQGQGDFWLGDRVGTTVLGMPENLVYVERVTKISYEYTSDGPSGWQIDIGHREPEDPMMAAFDQLRDILSALQQLGVV